MNILEVKHLKKYFATQKAVDDISFTLAEGSIFGMLGPNGAGKTTLIRMLTGITFPDEGEIIFNGRPLDPVKDIGLIGYMPEEKGLYKKMKIGEQALYLARLKGLGKLEAMERVREWFTRFEMQSWWNKKVEDLSKGMQQKLQFVTTVLHQPKLIILDEPLSGLDPVNADLIKREIFRLAKEGASVIFSTHRMKEVEEICDHIILVNKGHKVLDGTVKEIKQLYKQNLFSISVDNIPATINTSAFKVVKQEADQLLVKVQEGHIPNEVLQYFLAAGVNIHSFQEQLPSLHDIFIRVVEDTPTARQFEKITA
ncbi:ATP-binding cassette domain-containing protein [Paraflavitalea sp. CAU 1676]|uniref:ABC transporter ATP-binding protein n=1 Tax=Paraflavitalea sp. CAU 1676 TaxID=3032598 RepID=UPI0023DAAFA1|nr:ATP-binding cassette domain-containing protein [Paraflavitalea sp. CAU 1676]MDF2187681.1 ATP-binding cassette domain-containing protein [Paraflavitalea sp. CAU 1676]